MNIKLQKASKAMLNKGNEINFKLTKDKQDILIVHDVKKFTMFCLLVEDDKIKKVAILNYLIDRDENSIYVEKLDVVKEYQFISIGSNMMSCLQDYARNLGLSKIELVSLTPSLAFYKKLGFEDSVISEDFIYSCNLPL